MEPKFVLDQASVENVKRMVNLAPSEFRKSMKGFMIKTGERFIGSTKGKEGKIQKLLSKKMTIRGEPWALSMVKSIRFKLDASPNSLDSTLHMGLLYKTRRKNVEILESLESGASIRPKNGKFLIIPSYHVLKTSRKPIGKFHQMNKAKLLDMRFANGKIYYISKQSQELMFIGQKSIKIKKVRQLDIQSKWGNEIPKVMVNAQKAIEKTIKKIEKKL